MRNASAVSVRSLSPGARRLVQLMQTVNYGRIERLQIRDGEPVFEPAPLVIREIKFGGDNGPRPEVERDDFMLKSRVRELFDRLAQLGTGTVPSLVVKAGLPFQMTLN